MRNLRNAIAGLLAGGSSISRVFSAGSGRGASKRVPDAPWPRRHDETLRLYRQGACSCARTWAVKGGAPVLAWLLLLLPPGPASGGITDEYALRQTLPHLNNPPRGTAGTEYPVAMRDDRLIVGVPSDDSLGVDVGIAHVYQRNPATGVWQQLGGDIRPPASVTRVGSGCQFGAAVAIHGDGIAVTARNPEQVCLYRLQNGQWAPDGEIYWGGNDILRVRGLDFGFALAMEADQLLVSCISDARDQQCYGRAYLYRRNAGVNPPRWEIENEFASPVKIPRGRFGYSVSLSGDRAAIGQIGDPATMSGDVFVFRRGADQTWSLEGSLPHVRGQNDFFGMVADISGSRAMVGRRGQNAVCFYAYENGQWRENGSFSDLFWAHSISLEANGRAAAVAGSFQDTYAVTYKLNGAAWVRTGDFLTPNLPPPDASSATLVYNSAVGIGNNAMIVGGTFGQDINRAAKDMGYIYDLRTEEIFTAVNLLGRKYTDWFAAAKGSPISYWIDVTWDARVPMNLRHVRVELWDVRNMTSVVCRDLGSNAQNRDSASGGFTPTAGNMPHRFAVTQSNAGVWPANLPGPAVTVRYRYLWGSAP